MPQSLLIPLLLLLGWMSLIENVAVEAEPLWLAVCTQEDTRSLPFCDESLNLKDRVADYVDRIPTENQIQMMSNAAGGYDPLHIPPYQWWSEGLHGPLEPCVTYQDLCACPTSFPSPSAMANAFNRTLYHLIGHAIGVEGRAISNLRPHDQAIGDGLTYWSPTLNMQRDPRWGRNQEVPGEDPFLTSQYAKEFVDGLQGADDDKSSDRIRVGACCKHFVANSLEHWKNWSRHNFDAIIDEDDLYDYYFPPFNECTKKAVGVMCSYNAVNGKPACANPWLLQDVLRNQMNFSGYLVTDCGALADVLNGHHFAKDAKQAATMAKNASVDVNCGSYFPKALLPAYQEGMVEDSTIRESFYRMAMVQFRLGLFDSVEKANFNPLQDISAIGSPWHSQLAEEAALQSIVLLKNKNNILPLDGGMRKRLAIIGPHVNASEAFLSNYHGDKCGCARNEKVMKDFSCIETPLQAITRRMVHPETINSVQGCNIIGNDINEIEDAKQAALDSDVVILLVGLDGSQEGEELDRYETTLPGLQQQLVESILAVAAERTVIVLIHGGAMSLGEEAVTKAAAILSAGYGGQAASRAIASVLFGDYNPTGKLAATWYPSSFVEEMPMTEMGLKVGVGRTHMYFSGIPEFAFGHGLSYSEWALEWADNVSHNQGGPVILEMVKSTILRLRVTVRNLGAIHSCNDIASKANALLFWRPTMGIVSKHGQKQLPRQKLIDFQSTSKRLKGGEFDELEFQVKWQDFALWNSSQKSSSVVSGTYEIVVVAADSKLTRYVELIPTSSGIRMKEESRK